MLVSQGDYQSSRMCNRNIQKYDGHTTDVNIIRKEPIAYLDRKHLKYNGIFVTTMPWNIIYDYTRLGNGLVTNRWWPIIFDEYMRNLCE